MDPIITGALITGLLGVGSQWFNKNRERKAYKEMQDYNSPAAQMQRYREAGLSPYLIYGQGNPGNVSSPSPSYEAPDLSKGIEAYMSYANFDKNQKLMNSDLGLKRQQLINNHQRYQLDDLKYQRQTLEMYADFPDWIKDSIIPQIANTSYRRKVNELKTAASKAAIDRLEAFTQNLNYKNKVDKVRAKYAEDYGMVGGDWTQGLGLLKSASSFFKGRRQIPANEKALIDTYRKFKGDQYKRDAGRFLFEQLK